MQQHIIPIRCRHLPRYLALLALDQSTSGRQDIVCRYSLLPLKGESCGPVAAQVPALRP